MASDAAAIPFAGGIATRSWVADAGYIAFLALTFVTLAPFASRDPLVMAVHKGEGDMLRQVAFLGSFALIIGSALWYRGLSALRAIPLALGVTLGWVVLSSAWSMAPDVTLRRAILAAIVVIAAMVSVDTIGRERAMRIFRWFLIGILIVNLVSGVLLPGLAIHQANDPEPDIIGGWRGIYFHKNIAGAVTALSAIVFLFDALEKKRWQEWALFAASLLFLVLTASKTSVGLLVVALIAGGFYRLIGRGGMDAAIGWIAAAFILVVGGGLIAANWDTIVHTIQDPAQFTGRAAIWQAEAAYIADHPMLGAGYGTFADTGGQSPLYIYMGAKWIGTIAHGHSGYLQAAVETGLIGLLLVMVAVVVQPIVEFGQLARTQSRVIAMHFTIFVFVLLHNTMESDFLEGDAPQWVAFLMAIAMMRGEWRDRFGRP